MTDVTIEQLGQLRAKFPPEVVGKLPKLTCPACSKKNCQEHKKSKCQVCGNYISSAHLHLNYVGHAEVTDRLLTVDPAWSWEPVAFDERGLPAISKQGNEWTLWIRLTVCGITRLGVGSVAPNSFDAEKQLIGDALRNAAMRFGVALDLWAKEELESSVVDITTGEVAGGGDVAANPPSQAAPPASPKRQPQGQANPKREEVPPAQATTSEQGGASAAGASSPAATNPNLMTAGQNKMLHALLNGAGKRSDEDRHKFASDTLGREVTTYTSLTKADATKLIDALKIGVAA